MPRTQLIEQLRKPSPEAPLRILSSACLQGTLCGYDGTAYGHWPKARNLRRYPTVQVVTFCPEDYAFGTPRALCDIEGGNGFDVLDGNAKVMASDGKDWTEGLLEAAQRMLALAQQQSIELCILMDISAACGSQVIYEGSRLRKDKRYQAGPGVCAALLQRHGFPVISQRDYASLERLYAKLDPVYELDRRAIDHDQTEWYRQYF